MALAAVVAVTIPLVVYNFYNEEEKKRKGQLTLPGPPEETAISPLNSKSIEESSLGQYLESINTSGTWIETTQKQLGYENGTVTALDAAYIAAGGIGFATLFIGSLPALLVGAPLVAISAIGMNDPNRRNTIGTGVAATAATITNPGAAAYVAKQAIDAGKTTVNQTVDLAKTTIGFGTALLGLGSSVVVAQAVVNKRKNNKRKSTS